MNKYNCRMLIHKILHEFFINKKKGGINANLRMPKPGIEPGTFISSV